MSLKSAIIVGSNPHWDDRTSDFKGIVPKLGGLVILTAEVGLAKVHFNTICFTRQDDYLQVTQEGTRLLDSKSFQQTKKAKEGEG